MKYAITIIAVLALAACSKQEPASPAPVEASAPAAAPATQAAPASTPAETATTEKK